jgi:hypothetical protein
VTATSAAVIPITSDKKSPPSASLNGQFLGKVPTGLRVPLSRLAMV